MENLQGGLTVIKDGGMVADLTTARNQYCSLTATTTGEKVALYNATNNPQFRIGDKINEEIEVAHIYMEEVECKSEQTGELEVCPRVVLIDGDMQGYTSVSYGIFSALKKIVGMFGEPSQWESPLKIKVKQIGKGDRKILTLELVA